MKYIVTGSDLAWWAESVEALVGEPDKLQQSSIPQNIKAALFALSAEIGTEVEIVDYNPKTGKNPEGYDKDGTLPQPLSQGVVVPMAAALTAEGLNPVSSMSEGGDSVSFRAVKGTDIREYLPIYSRYKRLRTPLHNKGV